MEKLSKRLRRYQIKDVGFAYFSFIVVLLIELFSIFITSYYINLLSGEAVAVEGTLQGVRRDVRSGQAGVVVCVDKCEYIFNKRTYSSMTYGIKDNINMNDLVMILTGKIGSEANIEYIALAKNCKYIMRLAIDGVEYVDEFIARNDNIAEQKSSRDPAIVLFVLTIVLFIFVKHYMFPKRV